MKKSIFLATFLFGYFGFAQVSQSADLEQYGRINLGLHGLEFSYEFPVSRTIIWENNLGIGMGMDAISNSPSYTFYFDSPTPFVKSQLKWIYNRDKRESKGKSLKNNSGNYVGLQSKYSFGDREFFDLSQAILTEIHWGIQRNLGQKFSFNLHLGLGYIVDLDFEQSSLTPTFGLRFGYRVF